MNDLSWMLYWADVLPSLALGLSIFTTLVGIFSGIALVVNRVCVAVVKTDEDAQGGIDATRPALWIFPLALVLALATNLVPSRDTFYAIAASEMGEEALKSPIATKAGKALEKWLDDQLGETKESGK